jgi:signal transduction histidine kinase
VHLELPENACEVTASQRLALYRTAQEGLTNIQRHAAAHQVWLRLECAPDRIALQVLDDGCGLPAGAGLPDGAGFGLRGLRERAAQLDGAITLADRPGGGTILAIQLPVQEG